MESQVLTSQRSSAITVIVLGTLPENVKGLDATIILPQVVRTIIKEVTLQCIIVQDVLASTTTRIIKLLESRHM